MFHASIVKLNDVCNLETALEKLEESRILDDPVDDEEWPDHEVLTKRWNPIGHPFEAGINELQTGTRESVRFLIAEGYNERTRRKDKWFEDNELRDEIVDFEDRINKTKITTIFFEYDSSVYASPWTPPNNNMNTFCNDLLPEGIWGNVEKNPTSMKIGHDFYYWMLNAFTRESKRVSFTPEIFIRAWTGFSGTSQDSTHRLSGDGDRISAILSSLAFIFMDDPFKALNLVIQYEHERIPVLLGALGNLEILENEYEGQYANRYGGPQRKVLLTILMYTKVLPALFNAYNEARNEGKWNASIKEEFTNYIGDTIIKRVTDAIESIKVAN
ncbi:hypothetical protein NW801_13900 [Brevibacillus laterosporus]|uniref:Uncharacterized protein n=1 Tax=Brevibacillus halotolerans TaxID=1507437 RepID=A0ABT4HYH1_9BACL|nr:MULTISPECIES: hypothetical protein [Brevibacillus]MCR8986118.1 hypothetical protein [Brevibacillus laterosporus]MCZ0831851.1 hypothetical protein [Brevibacillus halotolerans]